MAFFIATGIISNDIVRKETRKGVLATFRLETGAPRGRKLWIDIECWGHLAGTIAHHGSTGRVVSVSGRLTQRSWRDRVSGQARHRVAITAYDIDLLADGGQPLLAPNSVLLCGTIEHVLPPRIVSTGTISFLEVSKGRAGTKTGRLVMQVEHWTANGSPSPQLRKRSAIVCVGALTYPFHNDERAADVLLSAQRLSLDPTLQ